MLRYNSSVYQPPEIILDLFAEYRLVAGLPALSRADLYQLLVETDAPPQRPAADPARVIRFPLERRVPSPKTTG
jgi:hypothetical protein